MANSSESFIGVCQEQGITLSSMVLGELSLGRVGASTSTIHNLVGVLHARLARGQELKQHVDAPIDTSKIADGSMRLFAALLNLTVDAPDKSPYDLYVPNLSIRHDGMCEKIEPAWCATITAADQGEDPRVHVYASGDTPILMRKGKGYHPSGVLLGAVKGRVGKSEHEIVYPAGTIIRVNTVEEGEQPMNLLRGLALPNGRSEVLPSEAVGGMSFGRLSPLMHNDPARRAEEGSFYRVTVDRPLERLTELAHSLISAANGQASAAC